jgi:hypothetical protein
MGPWRIGLVCDARLICDPEYSRGGVADVSPMVPVCKVVATIPQPTELTDP